MRLYPLKFKPVYKDYIWGGIRIGEKFARDLPEGVYAESWDISAHPDGMSVVENGELAGRSLAELAECCGADLLGARFAGRRFPLLIKLIDADRNLSVQVHPHAENAHLTGGEPKTEIWYVLDARPGTELVAGLKSGVDREELGSAIADGSIERLLHREPIRRGDALYMPGGRVHAICAGALILEVQQNSNTTYRIYDWGRVGDDGRARQLHVEEALKVVRLDDCEPLRLVPKLVERNGRNEIWRLIQSPYFEIERMEIREPRDFEGDRDRFAVLFCEGGGATVVWPGGELEIEPGRSLLLPASLSNYSLKPAGAECGIIRITAGDPQ